MFAKLYDTEVGQILVKIDSNEETDRPEVRFYFEPKELGVCQMGVQFTPDENGSAWDQADKFFKEIDKEVALGLVKKNLSIIPK